MEELVDCPCGAEGVEHLNWFCAKCVKASNLLFKRGCTLLPGQDGQDSDNSDELVLDEIFRKKASQLKKRIQKRKAEDVDHEAGPSKKRLLPLYDEDQNMPQEVPVIPQVEVKPPQEVMMEVEAQSEEQNAPAGPFAIRRINTRGVYPRPRDALGHFVKCETCLPNKTNRNLLPSELDRLKSSLGFVLGEEFLADIRPIAYCTRAASREGAIAKTSRKC